MLLAADQTLVGEEIFASGAYLERRQSHIASVLTQDWLRWIVILAIIAGFVVANLLGEDPRTWFGGPYP
jgi:hypothetical protein